jgi:hypothetical protein
MRKYVNTPILDIDIPPRLPVPAMAPIQLFPEESYVPRLNVSAEMANDVPSIVMLTLGIALQGTEKQGKESKHWSVWGLTRVKSAPYIRGVESTVKLADHVGIPEDE